MLSAFLCACSSGKNEGKKAEPSQAVTLAAGQPEASGKPEDNTEENNAVPEITDAPEETGEPESGGSGIRPDVEFCVLDGVKFGMTMKEVIAVLGDPEQIGSKDDKTVIKYGESEIVFGDYSAEVKEAFRKNFPDMEIGEDSGGEQSELLLSVINIWDHSLDDRLYKGVVIGGDTEELLKTFYVDENTDISDEAGAALAAQGYEVLYGAEDVMNGSPDAFGTETHTIGIMKPKQGDDEGMAMYQAYKGDLMSILVYVIDENGKILSITEAISEYR